MAKRVLGRGLNAIISGSSTPVDDIESSITEDKERIVLLDLDRIKPNPDQPRSTFGESGIRGLAESIRSVGIIQPIIVRKAGEDYFVVAGERRVRAAKIAGLKKIKSIVIRVNEEENITLALIENIQRSDLNPIEEAKAYKVMSGRFKMKQQEIAERVGKDRATVANTLRLLNLAREIQQSIAEGQISTGHAKALLSASAGKQKELFREIIEKGLSVRAVEKRVEADKDSKGSSKSMRKEPHLKKMEDMLISILGTKVEIKHSGGRGKIEINYYSLDDFERIIELLK